MTLVKVHWLQIDPHPNRFSKYFNISCQLLYMSPCCRKVHHGGLGKEGNSVPWFGGETGSTKENPGRVKGTLSKRIKYCLDFRILNSASSGSAASCSLGWRQAMGNVARWWPAVCCQFHLSSHWCQEGSRLEQRGCPAGHQWGHRWPRGGPLLEVRMLTSDLLIKNGMFEVWQHVQVRIHPRPHCHMYGCCVKIFKYVTFKVKTDYKSRNIKE